MCPGEKNNGDLTPKALALKHGMLMLGTGEDAMRNTNYQGGSRKDGIQNEEGAEE